MSITTMDCRHKSQREDEIEDDQTESTPTSKTNDLKINRISDVGLRKPPVLPKPTRLSNANKNVTNNQDVLGRKDKIWTDANVCNIDEADILNGNVGIETAKAKMESTYIPTTINKDHTTQENITKDGNTKDEHSQYQTEAEDSYGQTDKRYFENEDNQNREITQSCTENKGYGTKRNYKADNGEEVKSAISLSTREVKTKQAPPILPRRTKRASKKTNITGTDHYQRDHTKSVSEIDGNTVDRVNDVTEGKYYQKNEMACSVGDNTLEIARYLSEDEYGQTKSTKDLILNKGIQMNNTKTENGSYIVTKVNVLEAEDEKDAVKSLGRLETKDKTDLTYRTKASEKEERTVTEEYLIRSDDKSIEDINKLAKDNNNPNTANNKIDVIESNDTKKVKTRKVPPVPPRPTQDSRDRFAKNKLRNYQRSSDSATDTGKEGGQKVHDKFGDSILSYEVCSDDADNSIYTGIMPGHVKSRRLSCHSVLSYELASDDADSYRPTGYSTFEGELLAALTRLKKSCQKRGKFGSSIYNFFKGHPYFSKFPTEDMLREAQDFYRGLGILVPRDKHSIPVPHPTYSSKDDFLSGKDFTNIDDHTLNTPKTFLNGSLTELVRFLIIPARDDIDRFRCIFRWITAQDLTKWTEITDAFIKKSPGWYLSQIKAKQYTEVKLLRDMCK